MDEGPRLHGSRLHGLLLDGSAGGAAIRIQDGIVHEEILIPLGDGQVTEGEVDGVVSGTKCALSADELQILMVSDSQAGLKGIRSTLPRSGQFRVIKYDRMVSEAMERLPGLQITNLWTPAHIGTVGNEFADAAAKAATLLPPPPAIPVSLTTCKHSINHLILERRQDTWTVANTGHGLRQIDATPPSLILRTPYTSSAARASISIPAQLCTNFSALNTHRFPCILVPSPTCDACGRLNEWEHLFQQLQLASYSAGILGAVDVQSLLSHPRLLKPVVKFIAVTGRFS
ncbi:hypothetical protein C8R43DRAFT_1120750 [Mycena crocata]|nr:hypothetical protein C8R43DRAFT_1120750 [Mycena crocata]